MIFLLAAILGPLIAYAIMRGSVSPEYRWMQYLDRKRGRWR